MMVFIKICYGPYEAHGVIRHRVQKLYGLVKHLSSLGYEIEIAEVNLFNRIEIIMFGRRIFIGDIRNFKFNETFEDDKVCQKAVAAVEEAKSRMSADENVPKYISIDKGMRFIERLSHNVDTKELLSDTSLLYEIPEKRKNSLDLDDDDDDDE